MSGSIDDRYVATNSPTEPGKPCANCGLQGHEHDKVRVYPDKGPVGSYHHRYECPT